MAAPKPQQCFELGTTLEYLSGIASVSAVSGSSTAPYPQLDANDPAKRYRVATVVETIGKLLTQLEAMGLKKSLEAAKELAPMNEEMQTYLKQAPDPQGAILLDHFADQLIAKSKAVTAAVKAELPG